VRKTGTLVHSCRYSLRVSVPKPSPFWQKVQLLSRRISSGAYVSLSVVPIVAMGESHSVGRRIGTFQTVTALGALGGIPISGHIRDATHGFEFVGVYAGMWRT
jgi:hypothetical protein